MQFVSYKALKIATEASLSSTSILVIFRGTFYKRAAVHFKSKIVFRWVIVLFSKFGSVKFGI